MSHVAANLTEPGKPLITCLDSCIMAAKNLGMEVHKRKNYKWFGHHVGDYPLPEGWTKEDMGQNAVIVLSVGAAAKAKHNITGQPYELAIVEDKQNPGCYVPMYDFYGQGMGLNKVIGNPVTDKSGKVTGVAPTFMQHYRMCADALSAKEAGDEIDFEEQKDGSWVSYTKPNTERLLA